MFLSFTESPKTSTMVRFATKVNVFQLLFIVTKLSIINVCGVFATLMNMAVSEILKILKV